MNTEIIDAGRDMSRRLQGGNVLSRGPRTWTAYRLNGSPRAGRRAGICRLRTSIFGIAQGPGGAEPDAHGGECGDPGRGRIATNPEKLGAEFCPARMSRFAPTHWIFGQLSSLSRRARAPICGNFPARWRAINLQYASYQSPGRADQDAGGR